MHEGFRVSVVDVCQMSAKAATDRRRKKFRKSSTTIFCILKANHRRCGKLLAIEGRSEPWRTITIILLDPGARDLTSGKAVMARAKQIYGN
ncbi:hypothetical protein ALC57_06154 [Trachymyrmex cornetzi]|uniref:Uncharacterized protein n=1 Tax=Trachymyrmex cornetzi TaxID=471704 RepID=A0A195E8K0_9HYME|nr:hypothetical protein ALC57_06154 [Trachymyrmex cornetzi]